MKSHKITIQSFQSELNLDYIRNKYINRHFGHHTFTIVENGIIDRTGLRPSGPITFTIVDNGIAAVIIAQKIVIYFAAFLPGVYGSQNSHLRTK